MFSTFSAEGLKSQPLPFGVGMGRKKKGIKKPAAMKNKAVSPGSSLA